MGPQLWEQVRYLQLTLNEVAELLAVETARSVRLKGELANERELLSQARQIIASLSTERADLRQQLDEAHATLAVYVPDAVRLKNEREAAQRIADLRSEEVLAIEEIRAQFELCTCDDGCPRCERSTATWIQEQLEELARLREEAA